MCARVAAICSKHCAVASWGLQSEHCPHLANLQVQEKCSLQNVFTPMQHAEQRTCSSLMEITDRCLSSLLRMVITSKVPMYMC